MLQFIKARTAHWGEEKAARKIGIEMIPLGGGFTWLSKNIEHDKALAREGWELCRQKMLSGNYDLIVLDGAPGSPKRTAEMVSESDIVILPTGASRTDLVPTLALARQIAETSGTVEGPLFALCRVLTVAEAAEARSTIADAGFTTLDGELTERPGYRQAQDVGRSASETAFRSLNNRAKKLARAILDRLDG